MATAKTDKFLEELECAVCLDPLKPPSRALSCMHTFCEDCLQGHIDKHEGKKQFPCPVCSELHEISAEGAKFFRNNFLADSLLKISKGEVPTLPDKDINCDLCAGDGITEKAVSKCVECDTKLCSACNRAHSKLPTLKSHQVIKLTGDATKDAESTLKMLPERIIYCRAHPSKAVEYYCKEHKALLCQTCYITKHSGDKCEEIAETAKLHKAEIDAAAEFGQAKVKHYESGIKNANNYMDDFLNDVEHAFSNVSAKEKRDLDATKKHYNGTRDYLTKMKEMHTKQLMAHLNDLQFNKGVIESTIKQMTALKEIGHPAEIIEMTTNINTKQEEWSKQPESLEFEEKIKIKIEHGHIHDNVLTLSKVSAGKFIQPAEESSPMSLCTTEQGSPNAKASPQQAASAAPSSLLMKDKKILKSTKIERRDINDIETTTNDDIIIADYNNRPVQMLNNDLTLIKEFRGLKSRYVTKTKDKKLAYTTGDSNIIKVLNEDGSFHHNLHGPGGSKFKGITVNKDNNFVVCESNTKRVLTIDARTGELLSQSQPNMFNREAHVAINSKDFTIVNDCNNHCIRALNDKSTAFTYGTPGVSGSTEEKLDCSWAVCTDAYDYIIVADKLNNRISLLTPEGSLVRHILTRKDGLELPQAVAVDSQGHLIVGTCSGDILKVKYRV